MKRLLVGVFVLLVTVAACAIVWWRTPAQRHEAREFGIVPYVSDWACRENHTRRLRTRLKSMFECASLASFMP